MFQELDPTTPITSPMFQELDDPTSPSETDEDVASEGSDEVDFSSCESSRASSPEPVLLFSADLSNKQPVCINDRWNGIFFRRREFYGDNFVPVIPTHSKCRGCRKQTFISSKRCERGDSCLRVLSTARDTRWKHNTLFSSPCMFCFKETVHRCIMCRSVAVCLQKQCLKQWARKHQCRESAVHETGAVFAFWPLQTAIIKFDQGHTPSPEDPEPTYPGLVWSSRIVRGAWTNEMSSEAVLELALNELRCSVDCVEVPFVRQEEQTCSRCGDKTSQPKLGVAVYVNPGPDLAEALARMHVLAEVSEAQSSVTQSVPSQTNDGYTVTTRKTRWKRNPQTNDEEDEYIEDGRPELGTAHLDVSMIVRPRGCANSEPYCCASCARELVVIRNLVCGLVDLVVNTQEPNLVNEPVALVSGFIDTHDEDPEIFTSTRPAVSVLDVVVDPVDIASAVAHERP